MLEVCANNAETTGSPGPISEDICNPRCDWRKREREPSRPANPFFCACLLLTDEIDQTGVSKNKKGEAKHRGRDGNGVEALLVMSALFASS